MAPERCPSDVRVLVVASGSAIAQIVPRLYIDNPRMNEVDESCYVQVRVDCTDFAARGHSARVKIVRNGLHLYGQCGPKRRPGRRPEESAATS